MKSSLLVRCNGHHILSQELTHETSEYNATRLCMGNLRTRFSWHQINSLLIIACILMWVNLQFIQAAWKISQALKSGSKPNSFNYCKCFGCLKKLAFELLQKYVSYIQTPVPTAPSKYTASLLTYRLQTSTELIVDQLDEWTHPDWISCPCSTCYQLHS